MIEFLVFCELIQIGCSINCTLQQDKSSCVKSRFCIWCKAAVSKLDPASPRAPLCLDGGQYGADTGDNMNYKCDYKESLWLSESITLPIFVLITVLVFFGGFAICEGILLFMLFHDMVQLECGKLSKDYDTCLTQLHDVSKELKDLEQRCSDLHMPEKRRIYFLFIALMSDLNDCLQRLHDVSERKVTQGYLLLDSEIEFISDLSDLYTFFEQDLFPHLAIEPSSLWINDITLAKAPERGLGVVSLSLQKEILQQARKSIMDGIVKKEVALCTPQSMELEEIRHMFFRQQERVLRCGLCVQPRSVVFLASVLCVVVLTNHRLLVLSMQKELLHSIELSWIADVKVKDKGRRKEKEKEKEKEREKEREKNEAEKEREREKDEVVETNQFVVFLRGNEEKPFYSLDAVHWAKDIGTAARFFAGLIKTSALADSIGRGMTSQLSGSRALQSTSLSASSLSAYPSSTFQSQQSFSSPYGTSLSASPTATPQPGSSATSSFSSVTTRSSGESGRLEKGSEFDPSSVRSPLPSLGVSIKCFPSSMLSPAPSSPVPGSLAGAGMDSGMPSISPLQTSFVPSAQKDNEPYPLSSSSPLAIYAMSPSGASLSLAPGSPTLGQAAYSHQIASAGAGSSHASLCGVALHGGSAQREAWMPQVAAAAMDSVSLRDAPWMLHLYIGRADNLSATCARLGILTGGVRLSVSVGSPLNYQHIRPHLIRRSAASRNIASPLFDAAMGFPFCAESEPFVEVRLFAEAGLTKNEKGIGIVRVSCLELFLSPSHMIDGWFDIDLRDTNALRPIISSPAIAISRNPLAPPQYQNKMHSASASSGREHDSMGISLQGNAAVGVASHPFGNNSDEMQQIKQQQQKQQQQEGDKEKSEKEKEKEKEQDMARRREQAKRKRMIEREEVPRLPAATAAEGGGFDDVDGRGDEWTQMLMGRVVPARVYLRMTLYGMSGCGVPDALGLPLPGLSTLKVFQVREGVPVVLGGAAMEIAGLIHTDSADDGKAAEREFLREKEAEKARQAQKEREKERELEASKEKTPELMSQGGVNEQQETEIVEPKRLGGNTTGVVRLIDVASQRTLFSLKKAGMFKKEYEVYDRKGYLFARCYHKLKTMKKRKIRMFLEGGEMLFSMSGEFQNEVWIEDFLGRRVASVVVGEGGKSESSGRVVTINVSQPNIDSSLALIFTIYVMLTS
ncbi:uncharacterized protein MONOS_848 [Monocercomonoides exilis]|uniref:uncharacterized protein n=1 Tax=Monocercomonoides exilis TaxID=2049356 RepID=UPI0035596D77|nr:hypothetical protein MONOS_848 [Monocercomonoides exilis]|eukprot:MONOS_848.1-p1 / transcript=MONOS_848.1 / gene=MONOS_848 / organism=Monocercomonoides_exilis_PA203 / gene_product=unspecified product / transcript_product=unspecified product / location=Mono_scaffold00014:72992-77870(-) / protein_length=1191 / sequence_SO=supercontig / SO=protein_coding / is_pseudo=false